MSLKKIFLVKLNLLQVAIFFSELSVVLAKIT